MTDRQQARDFQGAVRFQFAKQPPSSRKYEGHMYRRRISTCECGVCDDPISKGELYVYASGATYCLGCVIIVREG